MKSGGEVYTQENSLVAPAKEAGGLSITHLLYNAISNSVAVVSADQNVIIYSFDSFHCKKQVMIDCLIYIKLRFEQESLQFF